MKKRFWVVLFCSVIATLMLAVGCGNDANVDYGTLSVSDIEIVCGQSMTIEPAFSDPDKAEQISYSFEGNNISITDGVVKGLVENTETLVTAKTAHHTATFKVKVTINYGTLSIDDINITFAREILINPVFSVETRAEDIAYDFDGHNIAITDGLLKGLIPGTQTTVTASTAHHSTTFKVTVGYMTAHLADENGNESKHAIPTPDANYVLIGTVNVKQFRENGWTRTSAFAFNGSDNSWYNIELTATGDAILYGKFNGVEKYHIKLFNINDDDMLDNGEFSYDIALLKMGQETKFFVNDDLVCAFNNDEMQEYAPLGALEVTACANRENTGAYTVDITDMYYATEGSDVFAEYSDLAAATQLTFDDFTLAAEDGSERKFSFGIPDIKLGNSWIFGTTVTINAYDEEKTRPSAFAFNGSDNSWYNIETDNAGNFILYGRFNGVEKYGIHLFNKNDAGIIKDGKITYSVALLKKGQSTFFFINDKLVCDFTAAELNGYGRLNTFELTASTDVWRDGGAYSMTYTDTKIENADSDSFAHFDEKTGDIVLPDAEITSTDGGERKFVFGYARTEFVYTLTVSVEKFRQNGWTRPCAFAFNGSDNSWYNIEMGGDGQLTLYGRFNGVEKYGIKLFNINDEGVLDNGSFSFEVAILKKGQNTHFFVNDELVCSFSSDELNGYSALTYLEVSAAANRDDAGEYKTTLANQKISNSTSAVFEKYDALTR